MESRGLLSWPQGISVSVRNPFGITVETFKDDGYLPDLLFWRRRDAHRRVNLSVRSSPFPLWYSFTVSLLDFINTVPSVST